MWCLCMCAKQFVIEGSGVSDDADWKSECGLGDAGFSIVPLPPRNCGEKWKIAHLDNGQRGPLSRSTVVYCSTTKLDD